MIFFNTNNNQQTSLFVGMTIDFWERKKWIVIFITIIIITHLCPYFWMFSLVFIILLNN